MDFFSAILLQHSIWTCEMSFSAFSTTMGVTLSLTLLASLKEYTNSLLEAQVKIGLGQL